MTTALPTKAEEEEEGSTKEPSTPSSLGIVVLHPGPHSNKGDSCVVPTGSRAAPPNTVEVDMPTNTAMVCSRASLFSRTCTANARNPSSVTLPAGETCQSVFAVYSGTSVLTTGSYIPSQAIACVSSCGPLNWETLYTKPDGQPPNWVPLSFRRHAECMTAVQHVIEQGFDPSLAMICHTIADFYS